MITDLTETVFLPCLLQPTVADVVHCVFHRGKDPNEPDRRQVGADPLNDAFNPLLSITRPNRMSIIPDLDRGRAQLWSFWILQPRRDSRLSFAVICPYCRRSGQPLHRVVSDTLWAACASNLSSAKCLSSHKVISLSAPFVSHSTRGSFPVYLRDRFSRQHAPTLFQFVHLQHIADTLCERGPHGNYYSVTTPLRVWL